MRQALEDRRFDVRANFFTLVAITGVILYWRGVWTLWCVLDRALAADMLCILPSTSLRQASTKHVVTPLTEPCRGVPACLDQCWRS